MADDRANERPRWDLALLYAAALAGYPLVAGIPVAFALESRVISVPYRAVVLGMSVWALWRSVRRRELYLGALWVPLAVFWVFYLARMLSDTLLWPVPLGQPSGEYFLYAFGICFIPMLPLLTKPSEATLQLALRVTTVAATGALVAVGYLGVQALRAGDFAGVATGRFELWTLNPIPLGHLGTALTTLAIFQLRTRVGRPRGASIALLAAAAVGLVCTGVAASKAPLLALAINLSFLLFLDWREGRRVRVLVGALVIPLLAIQGALLLEALGFGVISRIQGALEDPARFAFLEGAVDQFLAHPFAGSSLDERESLFYPHNTFIESFMAVGLIGGIGYSVFHLTALRRALGVIGAGQPSAWVGILCVQYTIGGLFSGAVYNSNTMWAFLAAVVATAGVSPRTSETLPRSRLVPPPTIAPSR